MSNPISRAELAQRLRQISARIRAARRDVDYSYQQRELDAALGELDALLPSEATGTEPPR